MEPLRRADIKNNRQLGRKWLVKCPTCGKEHTVTMITKPHSRLYCPMHIQNRHRDEQGYSLLGDARKRLKKPMTGDEWLKWDKVVKCNWKHCAAGLGLAGNGNCFLWGDFDKTDCPKFIDEDAYEEGGYK